MKSIKHAGVEGLARRMAKMAERFDYTSSLDSGAFDGSLRAVIRTEVEKLVYLRVESGIS